MDPHEQHYLQRIGEITASAEKRIADLTVEVARLRAENVGLITQVDELERTTRDAFLGSMAASGAETSPPDSP